MHIRLINPNTSAALTADALAAGRAVAAAGTTVSAVRPRSGPASIETAVDELGGAAAVAELVSGSPDVDAFVVCCFGDTGIEAARELTRAPVVGMTEAALMHAALLAHRFAVVTLPTRTRVMSERVVGRLGLGSRCVIHAVDLPVLALEDELKTAAPLLTQAARRAMTEDHAEAVVLGCAGLSALGPRLARDLGVPVVDGVAAGVGLAESLVRQGLTTSSVGTFAPVAWRTR